MNAPEVERKIRTLVVDDSPTLLLVLIREVSFHANLEVVGTARDGPDAFTETRKLEPDLVLMDVHMPLVNGFQVAAAIRQQFPKVRVIITSSSVPENSGGPNDPDVFILRADLPSELGPAIARLFPSTD